MKPQGGKHAIPDGVQEGDNPPEGDPPTPPSGPRGPLSLTLQVRRGAAPPHGRGPLFASPGRHRNRRRDGHGAPAWAGASLCFPKDATGTVFKLGTAPPHARGPLFASPGRRFRRLREGRGAARQRPRQASGLFATVTQRPLCATADVSHPAPAWRRAASGRAWNHTPCASSTPQGCSPRNGMPPFRAQTTPTSGTTLRRVMNAPASLRAFHLRRPSRPPRPG